MSVDARVLDLLQRYEESQQHGRTLTPEELCRDCPELLEEVRRRLHDLKALQPLLEAVEPRAAVAQPGTLAQPAEGNGATQATLPAAPPATGHWPCIPGYEILGELGHGGMGVVYKARHLQLKRLVALKMILAGEYAGAEQRARFRIEAEAVARLQHPHIIQIHEVGEHDGRPYCALEFVDGGNLAHKLAGTPQPPQQAAGLVETLARAMQAAHAQHIVHRDLKPANVLLRTDGTPKITDFGLAKRLDVESAQTQSGALMGTPRYMAPEQAEGRTREIGPAADVYALGAMLYEMLTGRPPFLGESTLDILYQVRFQEPVPPSRLQPKVPRDLETICLKCLHKEPRKRYTRALDLAEDLRRFQAGEPVWARPVSAAERGWRWCRRNRLVASLLAAVALVLVLGAILSTWQAVRATQAEAQARNNEAKASQERDRAEANFALAKEAVEKTITRVAEDERLKQADFHKLRRELLASALPFYEEFVRQPGADTKLEAERGRAYGRLAYVQQEIGEKEQAVKAYEQMLAIFARLAADFPDVPQYRHELTNSYNNLGVLLDHLGRQVKAEAAHRTALEMRERLAADFPVVPEYRQDLAKSHGNLGILLLKLGKRVEAEAACRAAVGLYERLAADFPAVPEYRHDLAKSRNNLSSLLSDLGKWAEEEAGRRATTGILERLAADFPAVPGYRQELARSHHNLGYLLAGLGKQLEAEAAYRAALGLYERLAADFPAAPEYRQELAGSHNSLGLLLADLGKRTEAEAAYRAGLGIQERLAADFPAVPEYRKDLAISHNNLGRLLNDLGKRVDAEAAYRAALVIRERLVADFPDVPKYRRELAKSQNSLGILLRRMGKRTEAEAAYRAALGIQERMAADFPAVPDYRQDLAGSQNNLGNLLKDQGKRAEAEAAYRAALEIKERLAADFPTVPGYAMDLGNSYANLGLLVRDSDQLQASLDWFAKAIATLEPVLRREPRLVKARRFLHTAQLGRAGALARLGDHSRAAGEADDVAQAKDVPADTLYDLACVYALSSAAAGKDTSLSQADRDRLAERHAARAVELLTKSLAAGYFKERARVEFLKKDTDLDPLRARADFQGFLRTLAEEM